MKKSIAAFVTFAPILLSSACYNKDYRFETKKITSNVFVVDGDTVIFIENGKRKIIRIFGIDTPETQKGRNEPLAKYENYYGQKAKYFLRDLLKDKEVKYCSLGLDKYNRTVAKLVYKTGKKEKDVASVLLENGLARVQYVTPQNNSIYSVYEKNLKEYFYELKDKEAIAKKNSLNIWEYDEKDVFYKG